MVTQNFLRNKVGIYSGKISSCVYVGQTLYLVGLMPAPTQSLRAVVLSLCVKIPFSNFYLQKTYITIVYISKIIVTKISNENNFLVGRSL